MSKRDEIPHWVQDMCICGLAGGLTYEFTGHTIDSWQWWALYIPFLIAYIILMEHVRKDKK